MTIQTIKENISKNVDIIKKFEEEIENDGNRFNIFSILNLSSSEVRLHSNFIAELLNPKGTHSFKNEFLELFLAKLKKIISVESLESFISENAIIEVEKSTGLINENYTIGGRLDIVITDRKGKRIIIENKIFAGDQENQLLRYYNFDKKAILLYLTLDGCQPSLWSTNNELIDKEHFHCISYETFICDWIEKCMCLSAKKPKISETISQYLNILKDYTNQNHNNKMINEILNLISEDKDFYNSIEEISKAYEKFRQNVNTKFWKSISEKCSKEIIYKTENDLELKIEINEDNGGFYFGFYLEKVGERILTNPEVEFISYLFKNINPNFQTNEWFIAWISSSHLGKNKFLWQNKEKIFELNDENEMNIFTNEIMNELNFYIVEIQKQIK